MKFILKTLKIHLKKPLYGDFKNYPMVEG